ncbi:MAG: hypothetical protein ACRDS1_14720, partial [Pseudonocardiaceae bacterium]
QRCECGSGRKAKFCCGVRRGPSDTEMAKAFLAGLVTPAAVTLARFSREEIEELHAEMVELPRLDSSLQVAVPRLVTPEVNALLDAIEHDDVDALEESVPAVLARVDTPLERARLARSVIALRDAGLVPVPVAAVALLDLASPKLNSLVTSGLVQSAAVVLGAVRTPGGLLVAG